MKNWRIAALGLLVVAAGLALVLNDNFEQQLGLEASDFEPALLPRVGGAERNFTSVALAEPLPELTPNRASVARVTEERPEVTAEAAPSTERHDSPPTENAESRAVSRPLHELEAEKSRTYLALGPLTEAAYIEAFDRGDFVVVKKLPPTRGKLIAVRVHDDGMHVVTLPREQFPEAYAMLDLHTQLEDDIKKIKQEYRQASASIRGH